MKKIIAITGGIGSGKSSAAKFLSEMGYPVFSCDEIYQEVILSLDYIEKVTNLFPECIVNGRIDKKILAQIVFSDKSKLTRLNGIAHPLIMEKLFKKMYNCNQELVFAEVPLLFEGNYEDKFDSVIVIMRNKEKRIQSIISRDGITREQALDRINAQFDYDNSNERFKNCNAILIENNGTIEELKTQIQKINF